MGKKYFRFRAQLSGGSTIDDRWAFEVLPGKIVTYQVESSGFFKKTYSYTAVHTMPITSDTTVELWSPTSPGSGMCNVRTGKEMEDYHVYGSAKEFVAEVQREIDRARNQN